LSTYACNIIKKIEWDQLGLYQSTYIVFYDLNFYLWNLCRSLPLPIILLSWWNCLWGDRLAGRRVGLVVPMLRFLAPISNFWLCPWLGVCMHIGKDSPLSDVLVRLSLVVDAHDVMNTINRATSSPSLEKKSSSTKTHHEHVLASDRCISLMSLHLSWTLPIVREKRSNTQRVANVLRFQRNTVSRRRSPYENAEVPSLIDLM
jgi:hypothetical protein